MLSTNTTLYRQWFRGADNIVADSLSRDAYFLSNKTHEIFLQHSATLQVPKGFIILPVPKEICCFVTSVLLPLPVKQHWLMQQKPSKLAHSNVGYLSFLALELKKTYLQGFSIFQQNIIFSAFAQAMQEATFTKGDRFQLVKGTVNATLSYVAQAFRSNNQNNPRLDSNNKTCFIIQEQLRGYRNQDGSRRK